MSYSPRIDYLEYDGKDGKVHQIDVKGDINSKRRKAMNLIKSGKVAKDAGVYQVRFGPDVKSEVNAGMSRPNALAYVPDKGFVYYSLWDFFNGEYLVKKDGSLGRRL